MLRRVQVGLWIAAGLALLAAIAVTAGLVPGLPGSGPTPAAIGGPISLLDASGKRVTEAAFKGKPSLVFFGFTRCPEVCPTTLSDISALLGRLGPDADRLNVIFITIDPERDKPETLKEYLSNFDARIVGLSGSTEEIDRAARAFRVFYKRSPTSGGDYTMDHSTFTYLMDAGWTYWGVLGYGLPEQMVERKVRELLVASK